MKISVSVKYLSGVEDPEALTIKKNLDILGFKGIEKLAISKTYEFELEDGTEDKRKMIEEIASRILTNPIIQSYTLSE
ncbi:MAG: phosphoribosylformylglycinamidine synthase subunit PurS [Thermoplasmatales archaeon]|nr:phosphoribosylformylglycinamidine synthase subunit PurS [Thermoplasmatales archaeon]MCW6170710.1 phosphoribosylformylglycinamidine synthase subunit PurS [Thermoplasmatales archaeon]